jgi:hypothetical protein
MLFYYVILSLALAVSGVVWRISRRRNALPPGPKPWPIIGNLFDVPTKTPWIVYSDWAKMYGMLLRHIV